MMEMGVLIVGHKQTLQQHLSFIDANQIQIHFQPNAGTPENTNRPQETLARDEAAEPKAETIER